MRSLIHPAFAVFLEGGGPKFEFLNVEGEGMS